MQTPMSNDTSCNYYQLTDHGIIFNLAASVSIIPPHSYHYTNELYTMTFLTEVELFPVQFEKSEKCDTLKPVKLILCILSS